MHAGLDLLLEEVRHQGLLAVGPVVGADDEVGAGGLELLLEDDEVLVAEAHDQVHVAPVVVELLGHGVGDGGAHAAADDGHPLEALGLGGPAQGAHEVLDVLALPLVVELLGGGAHELEDDGDGTARPVIGGDGQGDALAVFIHAEDDELAGLALAGHGGGLDFHQGHGGVENSLFDDPIHSVSSFHLDSVALMGRMPCAYVFYCNTACSPRQFHLRRFGGDFAECLGAGPGALPAPPAGRRGGIYKLFKMERAKRIDSGGHWC